MKTRRRRVPNDVSQIHDFNLSIRNREVYLHSKYDSDEELGVDFHMSVNFIKNLNFLCAQNKENILIRMNTLGGNYADGIAIFDSILFSPSPTTILAYAGACSMSSIILQSADNRVLMPNTDVMVHFGSESDENNYLNFMSSAEFRKKYTPRMLKIYAQRCIKSKFFQEYYKNPTEDKVVRYIDRMIKDKGDWWMEAEEAVEKGFADGVLGTYGFETIEKIRINRKLKN